MDLLRDKVEELKRCFPHTTSVDYKSIDRICRELYEMGLTDGYSQVWRARTQGRSVKKDVPENCDTRTATTNPNIVSFRF